MVYAVKKKGETGDRLINRFKKQVQHSRVLMKVRHGRYFKPELTKIQTRKAAVMRGKYRAVRKRKMFYDYMYTGPSKKGAA